MPERVRGPIKMGGIAMSNLLFDERPLVLQPRLAFLLGGSDEAIILQQVHYWTQKNMNIRDGYSWVYNSMKDWHKQFYWISESSVKRIFTKLEKKGVLITGNYNKAKFDKTKWYRIDYAALDEMEQRLGQIDLTNRPKRPNGEGQVDPTNTIDYTETTTEKIDDDSSRANLSDLDIQLECHRQIQPIAQYFERNFGQITQTERMKLLDEYRDWYEEGVPKEDIIAVFNKVIEKAAIYRAKAPAEYSVGILKGYLRNKIWTVEAIEGEDKQFEAKKQQRQSGWSNRRNNASNEVEWYE